MAVRLYEKQENHSPGPIIAIVIIILLLLVTSKCHAQQKAAIDTMVCKVECIKQIVQQQSDNGKDVKYLAAYIANQQDSQRLFQSQRVLLIILIRASNSLLNQHLVLD